MCISISVYSHVSALTVTPKLRSLLSFMTAQNCLYRSITLTSYTHQCHVKMLDTTLKFSHMPPPTATLLHLS